MKRSWGFQIIPHTHDRCRSWSQHTVQHKRWNEALVLCPRVGFHQIAILTEETLDMHLKSVGVLEVVGEQNSPSHDDELKIKHSHREALVAFWTDAAVPASYSRPVDHPPFTVTLTTPATMVCECAWVCVRVSVPVLCNICYINLLASDTNERLRWERVRAAARRGTGAWTAPRYQRACESQRNGDRWQRQGEGQRGSTQQQRRRQLKPVLGGRGWERIITKPRGS